jgi:PAS domain S-box-containing protein
MSTEVKKCECHEICVNAISDILKEFNTHEQPSYNNIIKLFKGITGSDISCIYIVNSGEYFFDLGMSHIETDNPSPELKLKQEKCCPLILSYYRNILTAGKHIEFSSLEEIPEELKEVTEAFRERDINSVIIVPVVSEIHDLLGILIFEYKTKKININNPVWDFIFLAAKIFSYQLSHKFTLQNKEDKYGFLVKSVNLILYTLDNNGIITSITPNVSAYGYSQEDITGKNFSKFVHVDDMEKVSESFELAKETKEVAPIIFRSSDINGKTIWFEENGKAELDAKGNVIALHCYLRDITERMEARLKLQESEEKYRTVVELAHEGIVIIQGERIVYANNEAANMVGTSTSKSLASPFIKYVAPEHIILVAQKYMQHHNGEIGDYTQKLDLLHSNGKNIPVEINSTIISYNGQPASLVFIRNLTETIETEKALFRSEKLAAVGTLAGGVAHEFNNINVAILGFAQLALQTKELDNELKSWLERICNGAKRAGNITKKLLSFSQPA